MGVAYSVALMSTEMSTEILPIVAVAFAAGCSILVLVILIPTAISSFRRQMRIQFALKDLRSPPRKHWLLAHGPEVRLTAFKRESLRGGGREGGPL